MDNSTMALSMVYPSTRAGKGESALCGNTDSDLTSQTSISIYAEKSDLALPETFDSASDRALLQLPEGRSRRAHA